jgi:hypothetical protein
VAVDWANAGEVARRAATSSKNGKNGRVLLLSIQNLLKLLGQVKLSIVKGVKMSEAMRMP